MAEPSASSDTTPTDRTPAQNAFRRKVRREAYLTSGFENEAEKTRMVDAFYTIVWPKLKHRGWNKLEDGDKILFESLDKEFQFDRIIDVLSHVKTKHSLGQVALALNISLGQEAGDDDDDDDEDYVLHRPQLQATTPPPRARQRRRRLNSNKNNTDSKSKQTDHIEPMLTSPASKNLSAWKYGGRQFPKRSSRVGPQHQATKLPNAGSYANEKNLPSGEYADLIWSPEVAAENGLSMEAVDALLNKVPTSIKEPAIFLLAEKNYDAQAFGAEWAQLTPTDGSDWDEERIKQFHTALFQLKKDIVAISKLMGVPIKTVYNFYLAKFKFSDDYRLLKTILQEERLQKMDVYEHEMDECVICGDGGSLLICDGCEGEYHMDCVRPALARVPQGHWECDECVDKGLLAARDLLVRKSGLFKLVTKESDRDTEAVDVALLPWKRPKVQHLVYEPSDDVRVACHKMAMAIHEAFASQSTEQAAPVAEPMELVGL